MHFLLALLLVLSCCAARAQSGPGIGAWKNPTEGMPLDASYVLLNANTMLPNARVLTNGTNITVTDGGAGGSVTVGLSGQVGFANGGTGQASRQAAINALLDTAGMTSQDLVYFNGTNITRLARGSSGQFLGVNGSNQLYWATGTSGGVDAAAEVILGSIHASATNARILTQGTGITITNAGVPDGAMTIAIDSTVATLTGTQTLTNKTLTTPYFSWNSGGGIGLKGSSFDSLLKWANWGAARNITIPDPGADANVVLSEAAATINGTKTFSDLKISGTTFKSGSNTMTVPGASDTLAGLAAAQTLQNKTIENAIYSGSMVLDGGANDYTVSWATPSAGRAYSIPDAGGDAKFALTGTGVTHAAGAAVYSDGSKMMVSAAGSSGQPLLSNGASAPAYGNLAAANGGTGQTSFTKGDVLVGFNSTTLNKLAVGTDGYVLTADTASTNGVKWASAAATISLSGLPHLSYSAPTLSASGSTGDLPYFSASNTMSKRTIGSTGQVLTVVSGVPNWSSTPATKWNISAKSANFTANDQSFTYYRITASSAVAVTLPASPADGSIYKFRRVSGSANVTFTANGAETINNCDITNATTLILSDGGVIELMAVSGGWEVV